MSFRCSIDVRFRDLDALGHVNHAVYLTYLEVARTEWWGRMLAGRPFQEEAFLMARVEVDFRRPVLFGDRIDVELRCEEVGTSSFNLAFRMMGRDGELRAEARTVQVMVDLDTGRPRPIGAELSRWLHGEA